MDVLELKRQYESLGDDEIMRVWADKEGLTEIAFSVLSEEITKRGILDDPRFDGRVAELKLELMRNQRRFERHQRLIVRRALLFALWIAVAAIFALLKLYPAK